MFVPLKLKTNPELGHLVREEYVGSYVISSKPLLGVPVVPLSLDLINNYPSVIPLQWCTRVRRARTLFAATGKIFKLFR